MQRREAGVLSRVLKSIMRPGLAVLTELGENTGKEGRGENGVRLVRFDGSLAVRLCFSCEQEMSRRVCML